MTAWTDTAEITEYLHLVQAVQDTKSELGGRLICTLVSRILKQGYRIHNEVYEFALTRELDACIRDCDHGLFAELINENAETDSPLLSHFPQELHIRSVKCDKRPEFIEGNFMKAIVAHFRNSAPLLKVEDLVVKVER